ncbi:hypothetical protein MASR2M78_01740 [Treponema sp.]
MKRILIAACAALALSGSLAAQEAASGTIERAYGKYYEVRSELGLSDAKALAREMDLRFEVYERLFRFNPSTLNGKLRVYAFKDEASFDAYLKTALDDNRDGAAYLHYTRPELCELALVRSSSAPQRIIAHQAFVQFLRSFVPYAPSWFREGFAIFFETLTFDPVINDLTYEENLAWLDTVKKWGAKAPFPLSILSADTDERIQIAPSQFQPASWALVSFLLNADGEEYRRTLYESFMLLKPSANAAENSALVGLHAAAWLDEKTAFKDYTDYIAVRRTFAELIEDGRNAYGNKENAKAELMFMAAADLRPSHYAPHYYLGLLSYDRKDYALAENHYRSALQLGADEALVNYALGVNAAADGRNGDARNYLTRAKAVSPERYAAKADELLGRLK